MFRQGAPAQPDNDGRYLSGEIAGSRSSADTSSQPTRATLSDATTSQTNSSTTSFTDQKKPTVEGGPAPDASASTSDLDTRLTAGFDKLKGRMREWSGLTASTVRHRVDVFSKQTTTTFFQLAQHLNRATGYDAIDLLKRQVVEQEAKIKAARQAARAAKTAYDEAVIHRAAAQRDVNELLQRKSSWSDDDVGRFTALVRADHAREQEEAQAKTAVAASEDAVDREFSALMRAILARYHEEQVWSDKIRSASTYGSLAVLGVNLLVFVTAILFVEPWKRKRLAQTFERKVEVLGAETKLLIDEGRARIEERLTNQERLLGELFSGASVHVHEVPSSHTLVETIEEQPSRLQEPTHQIHVPHPWLGTIGTRSAVAGGAISLFTHSLFNS
ncbi:Mdm33 family-domain-containing protein [Scleroderma citrinum]